MLKKVFKSVRAKLFLTLCVVILMLIGFFIIINNAVLEALYYYNKKESTLETYNYINENLPKILEEEKETYELELDKIAINNNFEILIIGTDNNLVYSTNKNFVEDFGEINEIKYEVKYSIFNKSEILYSKENITIRRIKDKKNGIPYILLDGKLDSGDKIYIRLPITPIQDSVNISNRFIYIIGIATIVLGAIAITFITERFTKPIEELNDIANEMSNLNFKRKYRINDSEDEIDELGKSINTLSDKLEEIFKSKELKKDENIIEKLKDTFDSEYNYIEDTKSPARISVSNLKKESSQEAISKFKDESDEEYYPDLFDALKEGLRKGHIAKTFGKNVLEITFYFNKGVLIRLFANNIRAEHGIRVAETALFMDGKQIYEELDRLFLKLSDNQEDFWICSDFYDNNM